MHSLQRAVLCLCTLLVLIHSATPSRVCAISKRYLDKSYERKFHPVQYTYNLSSSKSCPIREENIDTALNVPDWPQNVEAFTRLQASRNLSVAHKVNVFVIGGSVTKGEVTGCNCVECLKSDAALCKIENCELQRTCSWTRHIFNWMMERFSWAEISLFDFSSSGLLSRSSLFVFDEKIVKSGAVLSSNDIIFIDESVNDAGVLKLSPYFELLVRHILATFEKACNCKPTIVVIEQLPHKNIKGNGYYDPSDSRNYVSWYRAVSRRYGLPLWSLRDVWWSYFGLNIQNRSYTSPSPMETRFYPIDPFGHEHTHPHPPWYVHLYMADVLAGCIEHTMHALDTLLTEDLGGKSAVQSKYILYSNDTRLPTPYFNISGVTGSVSTCNAHLKYALDVTPNSTFHPADLAAYESDPISVGSAGWREYIDHHGVPGWMINDLSNTAMRTLTFNIPDVIRKNEGYSGVLVMLKFTYLSSYVGMGTVSVSVCGGEGNLVDALNTNERISIPALYMHHLGNAEKKMCWLMPPESRNMTITFIPKKDPVRAMHHNKFKVLGVQLCTPSEVM